MTRENLRQILLHPLFIAGGTALIVAGIIYLTPLKHLNVIEPNIDDLSARSFYESLKENPEGYLFIDVRPEEIYKTFHAEGSINVPLHKLYTERHILPHRGKKIVLICSGGLASGVGYSYLEHYGFLNIHRIDGGIEQWAAAGLPIVSSR
jgi:rhodanese-related sulfurtransferase